MAKSLLEQLPEIVAKGRQTAEKILENLEGRHRAGLQTREWVLPAKDTAQNDLFKNVGRSYDCMDAGGRAMQEQHSGVPSDSVTRQIGVANVGLRLPPFMPSGVNPTYLFDQVWQNRLIYGDNLLAMAALLAGDDTTPSSLRGKIDLIYIDPTFDSKADQPLSVWVLCLYFTGTNLSNRQTAQELDLNKDGLQYMAGHLRTGIDKKKSQ